MLSNKGQTLLELVVVVAVSVLIIGALVFATISSLRNAQFSKNQSQVTKLAQEGIEKVRSLRDRNGAVYYTRDDSTQTSNFNDLWSITFRCPTNCYFSYIAGILTGGASTSFEPIPPSFQRQFQIEDEGDGTTQKKFTSIVKWTDFSGIHESKLTTLLRRL